MKIKYNKEADALYIQFGQEAIKESDEDKQDVIIDYAHNGDIVGIELLNASKHIPQPNKVAYEVV
ncbi:MAG: DUF2283 domain-containing protein [Prevotellaceae bacterium]|jgi:uncharacterized protein YuzE|nr:DUF2283 domain-containing protein [Prevotellaceae bacterium]